MCIQTYVYTTSQHISVICTHISILLYIIYLYIYIYTKWLAKYGRPISRYTLWIIHRIISSVWPIVMHTIRMVQIDTDMSADIYNWKLSINFVIQIISMVPHMFKSIDMDHMDT